MIGCRKPKQDARTPVARDEIARTGVRSAYRDVAPSYRNSAVIHSYRAYRNPSVGAGGSHPGSIRSNVVACYYLAHARVGDGNSRYVPRDDISRRRISSADCRLAGRDVNAVIIARNREAIRIQANEIALNHIPGPRAFQINSEATTGREKKIRIVVVGPKICDGKSTNEAIRTSDGQPAASGNR